MTPTKAMILAALRAEFDYYQKARQIGPERFIPTPDAVIKAMLEAALKQVEMADVEEPVPPKRKSSIVEAKKPRPRRR